MRDVMAGINAEHPQQEPKPRHQLAMPHRPSNLFISLPSTTNTTKASWRAARPPTPHRTFFSTISATHAPDAPPVPSLSFFEPDTPSSVTSPGRVPPNRRYSVEDMRSSIMIPGWLAPRAPPSPPSRSSTPSLDSSSISARLHKRITGTIITDPARFSTLSTNSKNNPSDTQLPMAPLLSPMPQLETLDSPSSIYSPVLSPRYMHPRTPPCPPSPVRSSSSASTLSTSSRNSTASSRVSAPSSNSTSSTSLAPSIRKVQPIPHSLPPRIRIDHTTRRFSKGPERVGWDAFSSPVRLNFVGEDDQEPRETIQERRLKSERRASGLRSVKSMSSIKWKMSRV